MASNDTISNEKPLDTPYAEPLLRGRPVLIVFEEDNLMEWHLLAARTTRVGRDPEQDIALHDETASRQHAVLHYENVDYPDLPPEIRLEDLGGRNGTAVNGKRLHGSIVLKPGDKLRMGGATMVYQLRTDQEIAGDERLRQLATTDNLTGLLNRAYIAQSARRELDRAQRYKRPLTILLLDLDDFKKVNDTYGHHIGDLVLEQFGNLLLARKRHHDLAGRWGGEEFCLVLPETNMQGALVMAERIRVAAENHLYRGEGAQLNVTTSIGVAELSHHDGTHFERLVERADVALYRAKASGKNRVCTADIGDEPTR